MIVTACRRLWLALGFLIALAITAAAQETRVESIRAQLFNERTGTLSDDITTGSIGLWNVIIGENQASSVLISVVLVGRPEHYDDTGTLVVTVYDDETKKRIKQRRFVGFLFDKEGRLFKPLLVDENNCSRMRVVARTKTGEKSVTIPFKCEE
jgi:hypothetical protein